MSLVNRLQPRMDADEVRQELFDSGRLFSDQGPVRVGTFEGVLFSLARAVRLADPPAGLAVLLPRGQRRRTLVLVGTYLTALRDYVQPGRLVGSVAVCSRDTSLRDVAASLKLLEGDPPVAMGRLVPLPVSDGRVRGGVTPLAGGDRRGFSAADNFMLFQRPDVAPPVGPNAITFSVVDASSFSERAWIVTYERSSALRTSQLWVGDLADQAFRDFCTARGIPIFAFDWALIRELRERSLNGHGPFDSRRLLERADDLPAVSYRLVQHESIDYELREVVARLNAIRSIAGSDIPESVRYAYRLVDLLGRLTYPLSTYDEETVGQPYQKPAAWLLERVEQARVQGSELRRGYDAHWAVVKGALKRVAEIVNNPDECPKWWALFDRLERAREDGESLRVLCHTRSERNGLRRSLVESGLVRPEEFGTWLHVERLKDSRLPYGSGAELVSLVTAPLPAWDLSVYCGGEQGTVEAMCYPFQARRLTASVERAFECLHQANHSVLSSLGVGGDVDSRVDTKPSGVTRAAGVVELTGWDEKTERPRGKHGVKVPSPEAEFWQTAADLYDQDLVRPSSDAIDRDGSLAGGVLARRVTFREGPTVFFAEDAECDVLVKIGNVVEIRPYSPSNLRPGQAVALLPGSDRGGLLRELMTAWDEKLGFAKAHYEGMFRRALAAAVSRFGVEGLAEKLRLSDAAVKGWVAGRHFPGNAETLGRVLELSKDHQAWENRRIIQELIAKIRSAHRLIGRILNDVVGESVVSGEAGPNVQRLEQIVGRDLGPLFEAVVIMTVAEVATSAETVPFSVIGQALDADRELVKGAP